MSDDGPGTFSGYGSTFGNNDRSGDTLVKGAFRKTLDQFKADGFIAVGHDWAGLPVATITDAYEDDYGLFIQGEFHTTPEAQSARTVVKERLDRGKSVGLSIGFDVKPGGSKANTATGGRAFTDVELFEVSIVTVPCNPKAQATEAKSADPDETAPRYLKADYLGRYAEEEMVLAAISSLLSDLMWNCVYPCLFDEDQPAADRNATLEGAFAEFGTLALQALTTFITDDATEDREEMKAQFRKLFPPFFPDTETAPAGGTPFETRLLALQADAEDCLARALDIQALRKQQGRSLSKERFAQFSDLYQKIGYLVEAIRPAGDLTRKRRAKLALLQRKAATMTDAVGDDHDDPTGGQSAPESGAGSQA
jgi:HK97 family phage prohead protease